MEKISVVCPTFNSAKFLKNTLESVLQQTATPFEIIISDDGSTDQTIDFVSEYVSSSDIPILLLKNMHRGPGAARNFGVMAASGDWIAFIDSDDYWLANKLEVVQSQISLNPSVNFICHSEDHIRLDRSRATLNYSAKYDSKLNLTDQLYVRCLFSTSAVVCRRELLISHGLFDESLSSSQDYDLWLRLSGKIQPLFIEDVLGQYRDRVGNISSSSIGKRLKNLLKIHLRHRHRVKPSLFLYVFVRWFYYCLAALLKIGTRQ